MKKYPFVSPARYAILILGFLLQISTSFAEELPPCIGYYPTRAQWGKIGVHPALPQHDENSCPEGWAFTSMAQNSGNPREPKYLSVAGQCCPLPQGTLSDEHAYAHRSCPPNHIGTGGRVVSRPKNEDCPRANDPIYCNKWKNYKTVYNIRCTKINTDLYQLGPHVPAQHWGVRQHLGDTFWKHINRTAIPTGIRYSVGRETAEKWSIGGCIGNPPGSFLTEKNSKFCGFSFAQLQHNGADPKFAKGDAVKTYPDCTSISNRHDKNARCQN